MKTIMKIKKSVWTIMPMFVMLVCVLLFSSNANGINWIDQQDEKVYEKVDQMPEFQGGQEELISFLVKSIQYPEEAKKKGTQGKVFVNFVVGKDGSITNAKILKAVDPLLDAEALRVITAMPKWIPGKDKGKEVAVQFTLPISFALK
ncbi:MAG: energy transducer TonB [Prolixibacteraceae bacterium]|nr:energy transducer TonB [Prolixibacteraceae bacterium]